MGEKKPISKRMQRIIRLRREWRIRRTTLQGGRCYYCGREMNPPTLDHLLPLCRGGRDLWRNVVAACRGCNLRKGKMTAEEFERHQSERRR